MKAYLFPVNIKNDVTDSISPTLNKVPDTFGLQ